MRTLLACGVAIAVPSTTMSHCGPTDQEAGQAVLVAAPLVMLIAMGLQWAIVALWQRRRPALEIRWRPNLAVLAMLCLGALAVIAACREPFQWAFEAFVFAGSSYLAFLLVATRILIARGERHTFVFAHLLPLLGQVAPAIVLALGLLGTRGDSMQDWLWILPGGFGWAGGGLFVLLLVEALVRSRRPVVAERRAVAGYLILGSKKMVCPTVKRPHRVIVP